MDSSPVGCRFLRKRIGCALTSVVAAVEGAGGRDGRGVGDPGMDLDGPEGDHDGGRGIRRAVERGSLRSGLLSAFDSSSLLPLGKAAVGLGKA